MKRLVIDTSNLLFRVASAQSRYGNDGTPEERAGLSLHVALQSINKYYKKFQPDQVAVTFEGFKNWRKDYTRSDECVSKRVYKANRVKDASMLPFFELMASFEDLARKHTTLICLSNPVLEGDDVFAGYVQKFAETGDEVIGISGDKDFTQLLKYKNFTLINPDTGKPRTLIDVCGEDDPLYFMFEKCMRGDKGDNVMTAFPRVRKTRLKECMKDEYALTQLMNETWSITDPETGDKVEYCVADLFKENTLLMDLSAQPDNIRKIIAETVESALENHGKWSFFHFTKFCGKYGLKQIAESADQYANLFNKDVNRIKVTEESQVPKKKNLLDF